MEQHPFKTILESFPEVISVESCTDKEAQTKVNALHVRNMEECNTPLKNLRTGAEYFRVPDYAMSIRQDGFKAAKPLEMLLVTDKALLAADKYCQSSPLCALIGAHSRLFAVLVNAAELYLRSNDQIGSQDPYTNFKKLYEQYIVGNDINGLRALAAKCPDQSVLIVPAVFVFNKTMEWVAANYSTSNDQEPFSNLALARALLQELSVSHLSFDEVINSFIRRGHSMTGPGGGSIRIGSREVVMKLLNFTTSSPKLQAAFAVADADKTKNLHRIVGYIGGKYPNRHLSWAVAQEGVLEDLQASKVNQRLTDDYAVVCLKSNIPPEIQMANAPYGFTYTSTAKAVLLISNKVQQEAALAEEEKLLDMALKSPVTFNKTINGLLTAASGTYQADDTPAKADEQKAPEGKVLFSAGSGLKKAAPTTPLTKVIPPPSQADNPFMKKLAASDAAGKKVVQQAAKVPEKQEAPTLVFAKAIPQVWFALQRWEARTGCHLAMTTKINEVGRMTHIGVDDARMTVYLNCDWTTILSNDEIDDPNYPFPNSMEPSEDDEGSDTVSDCAEFSAIYTSLAMIGLLTGEIVETRKFYFSDDDTYLPSLERLHEPSFRVAAEAAIKQYIVALLERRRSKQ